MGLFNILILKQADEAVVKWSDPGLSISGGLHGIASFNFLFDVDIFFICFVFNFTRVCKGLVQLVYVLFLLVHTPLFCYSVLHEKALCAHRFGAL